MVRANPAPATATHRLAAALVAEYLQTARLPYTLSLFLPEAGLQGATRQSREEITAALRLTRGHPSEDSCAPPAASTLARAFDACASRSPDEPLALQLLSAITGACGGEPRARCRWPVSFMATLSSSGRSRVGLTCFERPAAHTPPQAQRARSGRVT